MTGILGDQIVSGGISRSKEGATTGRDKEQETGTKE